MVDEKHNRYEQQEFLPIPTYEEATSSRPSSSTSHLGPEEVSHDAERQGLLSRDRQPTHHDGYQPPTVDSARSSLDLLPSSGHDSRRSSAEELQREIQQMDMEELRDPSSRANRFSKRITNLTHSLSSINLPFRQWLPSRQYIRARIPSLPQGVRFQPNWIIVGRIFAIFLVIFIIWLFFISDLFAVGSRRVNNMFDPDNLRAYVQGHIDPDNIRHNLQHATQFDHMAGTEGNYFLAKWVETSYIQAGLENVGLERFDVYLNYPKQGGRRVAIIDPPELAWEAKIEEELAYPAEFEARQTMVFHGHSKLGNVTGPLIYANYGSRQDFQDLKDQGIDVKGSIAVVRYYGSQPDRSLKVKAAEQAGAVGCIIYSDPAEDGFIKGEPYPRGRYMPEDGVQRGSVGLSSWVVGDVLSPGFASLPGEKRREPKDNNPGLPKIPSIPLAWRDAQKLLQALKGHGKKIEDTKAKGGVPDVEWWTGDSTSPTVHLRNDQIEKEREGIYNVLGKITGVEQPQNPIIVGNHRDAWCFGGADPGSGTAVMLEVVRIFGELSKAGWRPLRTIEFASWDGEEYNMIGSTEHVEARIEDLRRDACAYINVDVAVTGTEFKAGGPIFESALKRVLERVSDPNSNRTFLEIWDENKTTMDGLGSGSDFVGFLDLAGTSSLDMRFEGAAFPYHSCYDNFNWMARFGDSEFRYHTAMAKIWALLILDMADRPLLPLDLNVYAREVTKYVNDLEANYAMVRDSKPSALNFQTLKDAANHFVTNAKVFEDWGTAWSNAVYDTGGFESITLANQRIDHNIRMANLETNLLDVDGGLPGREQYKHIIFAPQLWNGYGTTYFPGVRDAIDEGEWELAQKQVEKAARILRNAATMLNT
ncbi:MAG: hypothetical protein LQ338_003719 [Usnochroma carphineum]|nr:MAG: hypothetical protein LQ338_003719 [Usnochroma carphineum]